MKSLSFPRCVVNGGVAAALLAGCGAAQSGVRPVPLGQHNGAASKKTFKYTGSEQMFVVPAGVTQVTITASGAAGASGFDYGYSKYTAPGGLGARVRATLAVTPSETLAIFVGGDGGDGGFNGGGPSGPGSNGSKNSGRGGGASDVRQGGDKLANRVVVGGGGGGGGNAGACLYTSCGYSRGGQGGNGGREGGKSGGDALGPAAGGGGEGGTEDAGGKGGPGGSGRCPGSNGKRGAGGSGGGNRTGCGDDGAGGGGGYYGGGGGGAGGLYGQSPSVFAGAGGGGGGGSSFAKQGATNVRIDPGKRSGDGLIVITW